MKRTVMPLCGFFLMVSFFSCNISNDSGDDSVTFNAIDCVTNTYYRAQSVLLAEGEHCFVYGEKGSGLSAVKAQEIADEFDTGIYGPIVTNFGSFEDVDSNGKIILLLMDIRDGYVPGENSFVVGGYFDPTHMFDSGTMNFSNEADMLFIDIDPFIPGTAFFYGIIAHEFQHMISYSNTALVDGKEQELWINEGLSSGAEYVYSGSINQGRVDDFNNDRLGTISQGNNFFVWYGKWEFEDDITRSDNYATVSLFFQWLRIHASNGTGIYKDILSSGYRDSNAVSAAAALRIDGEFSDWGNLLQTWFLANILCMDSGFYGYGGALSVSMPPFNNTRVQGWDFAPGEGIVSAKVANASFIPQLSGTNIRYLGIDSVSGTVYSDAPYGGDMELVFNANSDSEGVDEHGYIANISTQPNVDQSKGLSSPRSKVGPIVGDVHIRPGEGIVWMKKRDMYRTIESSK